MKYDDGFTDGYEATMLLAQERPDLIPMLRRLLERGGEGHFEGEARADLDELVRRGLLKRTPSFTEQQ